MKYLNCFLMLALLALSSTGHAAEKIYRWVDDEGVTHFTAHPPKNRESDLVRVQTGHSDPVEAPETSPENEPASANPTNTANEQSLKNPERCSVARKNLKVLQTSARVQIQEEGEIRYLDEAEQEARAEEARQAIAESC